MTYRPETRSRLRRRPVLLRRPPQRTPPRRPHRGAKRLLRRPHPRAHRQTRRVSHPLWSADRTEIPRSSQQLPARRVTEMPVHRRRHRHHPDPADDQGSRARRRRLAADLRRPDRAPMAFLDELAEYGHRVSIQPQGVRPGYWTSTASSSARAEHPGVPLRPRASARGGRKVLRHLAVAVPTHRHRACPTSRRW